MQKLHIFLAYMLIGANNALKNILVGANNKKLG
jgi:hypothetical protein